MPLNRVKIGSFVEQYKAACEIPDLKAIDVSGINRAKEFFEPARQVGKDTSDYKIVPPNHFACNLMHVGRDIVLPIALNTSDKNKIVSPAYTVFRISDETKTSKEFFFLLLNSVERDRYFWFHTDSSVRDGLDWDVLCDLEVDLPPLPIQQKYVDIYLGLKRNLASIRDGIAAMQRTCDAYMEQLLRETPRREIGEFIAWTDERNADGSYTLDDLRGISIEKKFIDSKADMEGVSLAPYKVVAPYEFAYVTVTSRNGDKISLAFNDSSDTYIVSSSYATFKVSSDRLVPEYLFMFLRSPNFDRYSRFNSWGSARETIDFQDFGRYSIPLPSVEAQQSIVNIFNACAERRRLADRVADMQRRICPILIKGAVEEARKER